MSGLNDKIAGKTKQVAGVVSNNKDLEAKGKAQELKGDMKAGAGRGLDNAKDMINDVKKKMEEK